MRCILPALLLLGLASTVTASAPSAYGNDTAPAAPCDWEGCEGHEKVSTTTTTLTSKTTTTTTTTTTKPETHYLTNTTTTTRISTKPTTTTTTQVLTNSTTSTTTTTITRSTTLTGSTTTTTTTTVPTTKTSLSTTTTVTTATVPTILTGTVLTLTRTVTTTSTVATPVAGPTVTVTSIATQPGSLVTVLSPSIRTATTTLSTSSCDFCKIDIYLSELQYPYYIATVTTVYATTIYLAPTQYANGSRTTTTRTSIVNNSCSTTIPTTWIYSGVVLTSPTHYIYAPRATHEYLFPSAGVYGGCGLSSVALSYPTNNVAALIAPFGTTNITVTTFLAPTKLVAYLDSLPTVNAQLNGSLVKSCDDATGTVTAGLTASTPLTSTSYVADPTPVVEADVVM